MRLSIGELALAVNGRLSLGSLPPLAGPYEPVRRIVVESQHARPGDVYWAITVPGLEHAYLADEAYTRGVFGVVAGGRRIEPWAGRFSIQVADANQALIQLATHQNTGQVRRRLRNFESADSTELVQAMLAGFPVSLEDILGRVARNAAMHVA
jgi:hypothetical protein